MDLSRIGIWTATLDLIHTSQAADTVAELDAQGWGAVWIPEMIGRDPLVFAGVLLAGAPSIPVATGIANIWGRDAMAMRSSQLTLADTYPERFLLGIGVSHEVMVQGIRNHAYERPLAHMTAYLDAMDEALFVAPGPAVPPQRVLGALGPRMIGLAAERADGAHTYMVSPDHTLFAREILGAGKILAVEQKVILESDPAKARAMARGTLEMYLTLPNYTNSLRRSGFDESDIAGGGSDRLVDALVAWGSVDAVATRVNAQLDAGASHVCIQVLSDDPTEVPSREWAELAPALLDGAR